MAGRRLALLILIVGPGCRSFQWDLPVADKPVKEAGPALPAKQQFRVSQFVFFADFDLPRDGPLFRELAGLPDQVYRELHIPQSSTLVQVYLFEDRERYEGYMRTRYPELPKRRAFFVAQPRGGGSEDLMVFTFWGDRVRQDLRHELTHALLHSVLKDVPLWLDEGLAEYFELPPDSQSLNRPHLEQLCRGPNGSNPGAKLDLARLEQLSQVQQMAPAEYREAWAWVHFLLRDSAESRALLIGYLQQLRVSAAPGPIRPRLAELMPNPEDSLGKHLARLNVPSTPAVVPAKAN